MDAARTRRLGRRLIELAKAAAGETRGPALTPGEETVFQDVLLHPGGTVGEIRDRTGFVQSHVSTSVARLRERGLLETAADPADGRRTLVRPTGAAVTAAARRAAHPVDDAIRRAVADPVRAERALRLLEELADLLLDDPGHP
ncbi:MarR family transcriptional regulator [Nonomuraea pusilla]|uniref:helix-turn-helix domain-containing protein n=1 Tax=Nonomuraea pusilla TaxID=46177 RepID=UPI00331B1F67